MNAVRPGLPSMLTIAAITIGQSPRDDLIDEIRREMPPAAWVQHGALDGLDRDAIGRLAPCPDDFPLITRIRSGETVTVGEEAIRPLLQRAADRASEAADLLMVVCSGPLSVESRVPVLFPDRVLAAVVAAIQPRSPIAVLTPDARQLDVQRRRWKSHGFSAIVEAASPYAATDFAFVGRQVRDAGASLVVLDCLGYSAAMKQAVTAASGLPAILVRSLLARVAGELIA